MALSGVWIPVTLLASSAQTLRNAMQRDLIGALGAVGAAQVRFLFGLPFAVLFLTGVAVATGLNLPSLTAVNLAWTVFGAVSQVIATSLMLAAMRTKSFVVAVAYTKTEAAQIVLFGLIALNNPPTARARRGDCAGDDRRCADGDPQPQGACGRLAIGGARNILCDVLCFRRHRFPLRRDRRRLAPRVSCPRRSFWLWDLAIQSAALGLYLAALRPRRRARHCRLLALLAVRRLHGRTRLPTLVHRFCP